MTVAGWLAQAEPLTRDEARELAREELSKEVYRAGEPSLSERIARAVLRWLGERLDDASRYVPGGKGGLALLVIVLTVVAILVLTGRAARRRAHDPLFGPGTDRSITAAEYRAQAERLAAAGDWKEAVRSRFRAIARELEERGVLDPRAGRTAGEVAAEAGAAAPQVSAVLRAAADAFGEVWYGDRPATPDHDRTVARADEQVRSSSLAVLPR